MTAKPRWYQTTAIDYPNSRPHIGTAFEKLGADVQARYRRMEGYDVVFLMGNDENTVKVSQKAAELKLDTQAYCDDMAKQFQDVWKALDISYTDFVQTSSERHKACCRKFIQKVYDNGHIYKGSYEGLYCEGCESAKALSDLNEKQECPNHPGRPIQKRNEPCYYFKLSAFSERLLKYYEEHPEFIQPDSRKNEIISLIKNEGLLDLNITRTGQTWGIRVPFDSDFTIFVWFDALLTYITGIGYGDDEATFKKYWPANVQFIGKDITRFHCAIWPAMLWAADLHAPQQVFGHGFVTNDGLKIGKSMGNAVDPVVIVAKSSVDAYRYYFLRECPFPGDGEYSGQKYEEIYNSELANNLGNLLSRAITLITKNYDSVLAGTANVIPDSTTAGLNLSEFVSKYRGHVTGCQYSQALQSIIQEFLTPTNQYLEKHAPWKLVKTDLPAAKVVLFNAVQSLRIAAILLKPFIPRSAEAIYNSFNFPKRWADVTFADAAELLVMPVDLRVTAELVDGKPKPLFPRIV
ncbi:methionine--tRNA ligase [soil metagenome]